MSTILTLVKAVTCLREVFIGRIMVGLCAHDRVVSRRIARPLHTRPHWLIVVIESACRVATRSTLCFARNARPKVLFDHASLCKISHRRPLLLLAVMEVVTRRLQLGHSLLQSFLFTH